MVFTNITSLAAQNITSVNVTVTNNTTLPPAVAAAAASTAICELSPHARALSTILTSFVGSIITGVTSGWFTAFHAAWISWTASLRILVVGVWAIIESLQGHPLEGGEQFRDFYNHIPGLKQLVNGFGSRGEDSDYDNDEGDYEGTEATGPTVLASLGWLWSTIYSPVVQTLWLVQNWSRASGGLKLVRAIGVSISALPLTMDTRGRFGASLGDKIGKWSEVVFNLFTATSCLTLGVISTIELILAVIEIRVGWFVPCIYVAFMVFVTYLSFACATPVDEARSANGVVGTLGGLVIGAVVGLFTAFPAYILMQKAQHTPGSSLDVYLKCESVAWWQKMVSVLP